MNLCLLHCPNHQFYGNSMALRQTPQPSAKRMIVRAGDVTPQPSAITPPPPLKRMIVRPGDVTRQPSAITPPLKNMIMRAGDPTASVVPILDSWVQQGNHIKQSQLQKLIRNLRNTNRFNHALQMLEWMGDKGGYELSAADFAVQLECTSRVDGIEQVEMYFDAIPYNLRGYEVYCALLRSYALHGCIEKAEATMQKLCDLGLLRDALPYNVMLSFYYEMREVGYADDMDLLAEDMREEGINFDKFTYTILLKVYAENLLIEKMVHLFEECVFDPLVNTDWPHYFGWTLRMLEKKKSEDFDNVEEADPLINLNEVYHSMICYLSINDDIDGAERFWEEWLSKRKEMDFGILRAMMFGYGMNGQWEEAEALVFTMRESGIELDADTIYSLASVYGKCKQMDKSVESSMKAISMSKPGWIPAELNTVADCFRYLKSQGNEAAKEELYRMLREHCGLPTWACQCLKKCKHLGNGYYKSPRINFEFEDDEGEDEHFGCSDDEGEDEY